MTDTPGAMRLPRPLPELIGDLRRAFGPPGDYGYDTPEGAALFALYRLAAAPDPEAALRALFDAVMARRDAEAARDAMPGDSARLQRWCDRLADETAALTTALSCLHRLPPLRPPLATPESPR